MELTSSEIVGATVGLVGFIIALLKVIHDHFKETKDRMIKMEERYRSQNDNVISLTGKVNRLEGEREGFLSGVEKISFDVIQEIRGNDNNA